MAAGAWAEDLSPEKPVSFRQDIAPIFQRRCVTCHGEDSAKGGYRLDSHRFAAKAGDSDLPPIVPGNTDKSELYQLLLESDPNDRMPQRAEMLPRHELALIERWIKEAQRMTADRDR